MKNFLLPLLLLPVLVDAQSGNLYGLYLGTNTALNSNVGMASVNPSTAAVNFLEAFSNTKIYAFGDHTVDAGNHHWFQVTGDSVNMYLLNFNIDSGTLTNILFTVDSVGDGTPGTVTIGGNIQGTFYNCFDNMVYFFHYKAPFENFIHFAKADAITGSVTEIDSFPIGIQVIDNIVLPYHQIAYWLQYNNSTFSYDKLVAYDLLNYTSSTIGLSISIPGTAFWVLTYNPVDGMLYGMQEDLDSFGVNNYLADLRFLKVDPLTGTVTNLTTDFFGNIIASNLSLDFSVNQLNSVIQTVNPGYPQICNYDIGSNSYTINNLSYTNFGNILYPSLIGIDSYLIPKNCSTATGEEDIDADCNDAVSTGFADGKPVLYFGCHSKDFSGMTLRVFDLMGRRISNQLIDGPQAVLNFNNTVPGIYFYSITDQNRLKASGKLMTIN